MTAPTLAARMRADADTAVAAWPTMDRAVTVEPLTGGRALLSIAGVDRGFDTIWAAFEEAESFGLVPYLLPFPATPL